MDIHTNGNDSGVDTGAIKAIQLQSESSGGIDVQFASCNSSSISVCSESHDNKTPFLDCKRSIDCIESSSLSTDRQRRLRQSPPKNRSRLTAETNQIKSTCTEGASKNRIRAASANRVVNQRGAPILATTERATSRDRQKTSNLQSSPKKRMKPMPGKSEQQSSILRRTSFVCRSEDGRWPSNQFRSFNKNEMLVIKSKVGPIMLTTTRKQKVKSEEDLSTIVRRQSTRGSPLQYQKATSKTLINHEASIQTTLDSQNFNKPQIDTRDREIQQLKEMIEAMDAENKTLRLNLTERSQSLTLIESQLNREREEKDQTQHSDHALEEKQAEIYKLRQLCDQLQVDMNRSIQMNRSILEEKKCFEKETSELEDFLQDEKAVISDALRDAENEIECLVEKLKQKEKEVDRLEDECRHLVRISEQRRLFIILTLVLYN